MLETIKVGSQTNQNALAGAIANAIRNNGHTTISLVGSQALFQAVKGLTLARRFLLEEKTDIYCQFNMEDNKPADGSELSPDEPKVIVKIEVTSKKIED